MLLDERSEPPTFVAVTIAQPHLPPQRHRRVVGKQLFRVRPQFADCGPPDRLDTFDQRGMTGIVVAGGLDVPGKALEEVLPLAIGNIHGSHLDRAVLCRTLAYSN